MGWNSVEEKRWQVCDRTASGSMGSERYVIAMLFSGQLLQCAIFRKDHGSDRSHSDASYRRGLMDLDHIARGKNTLSADPAAPPFLLRDYLFSPRGIRKIQTKYWPRGFFFFPLGIAGNVVRISTRTWFVSLSLSLLTSQRNI